MTRQTPPMDRPTWPFALLFSLLSCRFTPAYACQRH